MVQQTLTKEQYELLGLDLNKITIIKDRYVIPYIENLKIELDVFHGKYEGIVFAEIEFESESQAEKIQIPEWFGKEIGDKVSNDMMAKEFIDIYKL